MPLFASISDDAPETTEGVSYPVISQQGELRKAIAEVILEVEGRCTHGQSGEYGCFQFLPSTWKAYSLQIAGEVLPMTEENERMVAEGMIGEWLDEGIPPRGIFLLWNQGSATGWGGGTDCYKGVNDHGVPYNSCDYAHRALSLLAQRMAGSTAE